MNATARLPAFLGQPTRVFFFTGKGGVGKTSIACACAVHLAASGRRVLLVSTDPASNLDEVLATRLAPHPTAVAGVPGLDALNIDPQAAAAEYREGVVAPLRGVLPEATLRSIEEGLSGACTVEIAAFDQFTQLLGKPERTRDYDHILFDTAPTGHTLRLLKLPRAWDRFIDGNTTGTSCIGPLAGLQTKKAIYEQSVATLADGRSTTLVLVSRADPGALNEAARSSGELREEGIGNQHLVINGVFRARSPADPLAAAFERRGEEALAALPASLADLPRSEVALTPVAPVGLDGLRALFAASPDGAPTVTAGTAAGDGPAAGAGLASWIDALATQGHGVVMTTGKGGVGKTTLAAAIALGLAARGQRVRLTTTDPAAHLVATLGDGASGLIVERIDPAAETAAYRAEVVATAGSQLDAHGLALLEEDLRSPCTEEIAVFRAFARTVAAGREGFVVLDTAPTGHTLLLLDAALAYHREVERKLSTIPDEVRELMPRLRDPEFTRILVVTLAEATPVHEAQALAADLRRAGIGVAAWVVNQCLVGLATTDPVLLARARSESRYLAEVAAAAPTLRVPWQGVRPVGRAGLRALDR